MSEASLEPAYLDGQRGKLFVLLRRPARPASARCALLIPPFAEEMNKSRPMLAMVADALAARGIASVLPDLYGTGDSAGEFRDADWSVWRDDLERVMDWARRQGCAVDGLLAVRLGCILAAEFSSRLRSAFGRTVFWQPVHDGNRFMTQFLRLRVAASLMEDRKETVAGLREALRLKGLVEVAGYEVSSRLADQVGVATLTAAVTPALGHLHWMEVVRTEGEPLQGAGADAIRAMSGSLPGLTVETYAGEPFWSTTEIVRIPAMVAGTVKALAAGP